LSRIAGLSWSSNCQKLAVATAERTILLFDEHGERRDKFSTKPADSSASRTSYVIRGVAFSPDSTKLAVAQSDNIVYVYKLGENFSDKKVICNKFQQPSSVACMLWTGSTIIAGLEDGRVRALHCKNNKSQNLYGTEAMCVSLAPNARGTGIVSGHDDGSVIRFYLVEENSEPSGRLFTHSVAPAALAWSSSGSIIAAGCDKKVNFYDWQGRLQRSFDYSRDDNEREFMIATCSPNGQSVAVGSYDRIRIFTWSRQSAWNEALCKDIANLYSITALAWRKDGARLSVGTACGGVFYFESVIKRTIWQDKFEITFVAPSQVLLKSLQEPSNAMIVESQSGLEIDDVRIMGEWL
jgi:intraflagellar transport protein 172